MIKYAYDELFHESSPEEALDYLWSRLQDRDLSQDEALALLSAIHGQLARKRGSDPRAYFAYTRFMESLSREMPVVHDYVMSRWIENRRAGRRPPKAGGAAPAAGSGEDGQSPGRPPAGSPTTQGEGFAPSPIA